MTRAELIDDLVLQNRTLSRKQVMLATRVIVATIVDALVKAQRVEIRRFGTWSVRVHAARLVRNPKTGEWLEQFARPVVHFKPAKEMREQVLLAFESQKEGMLVEDGVS